MLHLKGSLFTCGVECWRSDLGEASSAAVGCIPADTCEATMDFRDFVFACPWTSAVILPT